jgi:5-methylcytosine-specific restriction endonuclease McrA
MNKRTCTMPNCSKPHRARGLCGSHYNQQHQTNRHAKQTIPCAYCGADCEKDPSRANRYGSLYCSLKCRDWDRYGYSKLPADHWAWAEVSRIWIGIGRVCAYCEQHTTDYEPDHVIPLSRGGSNSITNIVPCCKACNSDKRDLPLLDWYADRHRRGLPTRSLSTRVRHLTHALLEVA